MGTLNPQTVAAGNGTAINFVAAGASGDTITNASGAVLRVKNGAASDITVTFAGAQPCSQGVTHAQLPSTPITVTAGIERDIPVETGAIDKTTGDATVNYSSATSVTVAAVYQ